MKKYYLLTMMTLSFFQVLAQSSRITRFNAELGGGFAFQSGTSINFGLNSVINNKWTVGARYFGFKTKADVPTDYVRRPLFSISFGELSQSGSEKMPAEATKLFFISAGRIFPISRAFNFHVDIGVGGASGESFTFTSKPYVPYVYSWDAQGLSANYNIKATSKNAFALMFRTGIEGIGKWGGAGLHAFYNYNSGDFGSISGLSLTLMLGWMDLKSKTTAN